MHIASIASEPAADPPLPSRRAKAVVALTFGVTPPRGGGQSRVFHLYRHLAEHMDVTLVCLCESHDVESHREVAPGLMEVRVPKAAAHQQHESEASSTVDWVPVTDIVAAREVGHTPRFLARLDAAAADADVVVASHPYFASVLLARFPRLPLWYEAHNVELQLKRGLLPAGPASDALLRRVEEEEGLAWKAAQLVYACTEGDLATLQELYGETAAATFEVPNGYAEDEVPYTSALPRARLKSVLGLSDVPLVLFLGSWHGPNLEAAERLFSYAGALPHATFLVVGSAGLYFRDRTLPGNVRLLGTVDEEEKKVLLSAADLAINPMTSGSGSNLKMLDYFGSGLPVVSTAFGARGIAAEAGVHFVESDIDSFLPTLVRVMIEPGLTAGMAERARRLVKARYTWRTIADAAWQNLSKHVGHRR